MIVITDIKYYEVPCDEHAIYRTPGGRPYLVRTPEGYSWKLPEAVSEDIKGRRFRRRDQEWIIGLSDEVAEVFQLQAEAWENMEATIESQSISLSRTRTHLDEANTKLSIIGSAPWWRRLKWLFTGVPT